METRDILENLLDVVLENVPNQDRTSADYCNLVGTLSNDGAATLFTEVKRELGIGGSDPSVQSSFSYTRFWSLDNVRPSVRQKRISLSSSAKSSATPVAAHLSS